MIPDVNVLVAAFRPDHEHDVVAATWLNDARNACARGDGTLVLPPMVVAGFLRVVTNHRVFIDPDPVQDAIAFVDALLETPGAEVCPSGHEWPVLRNKLMEGNLEGNLVTDAWIAAVVLHQSESLATFDKDSRQLLPAHALIFLGR